MKKEWLRCLSLAFLCFSCSSDPVVKAEGATLFDYAVHSRLGRLRAAFGEGPLEFTPDGYYVPVPLTSRDRYSEYKEKENLPDVPLSFFDDSVLFCWSIYCPSTFLRKLETFRFVSIEERDDQSLQISARCGEGMVEPGVVSADIEGYAFFVGLAKNSYSRYETIAFSLHDESEFQHSEWSGSKKDYHYEWTVDRTRVL